MNKLKDPQAGRLAMTLAAAAIGLASTPPAHANLVLDPGIEISSPGDPLDGPWFGHWAGPVDASSRPRPHAPHGGLQSAQFLNQGLLHQDVHTTLGQTYKFAFWLSGDGSNWEGERFRALWDGVLILDERQVLGSDWAYHSFIVTATSTPTNIEFRGESHIQLDDVSVTLIPEPATLSLLGLGLAGLGFSRRKRSAMMGRSLGLPVLGGTPIAAAMLAAVTVSVAAEPVYTVRELRPPNDDVSAEATALNARGEVVGFSFNRFGIATALKWSDGGREILHPDTAGGGILWGAKAFDINDLGQAVGVVLGYVELNYPEPPYYYVGGTGPIVWGAGDFSEPRCTLDDGAAKISNAGVVLNWTPCVYSIDPADAAQLEVGNAVGRRLYENGLVLNDSGSLGQALWGPQPDSPWDDRRFWAVTDLSTCGAPSGVDPESWVPRPWDAYICELASTGYERSRTTNARGQYIVNEGNRAFLYTPISEPPSLAIAGLLLALLMAVRPSAPPPVT